MLSITSLAVIAIIVYLCKEYNAKNKIEEPVIKTRQVNRRIYTGAIKQPKNKYVVEYKNKHAKLAEEARIRSIAVS